MHLSIKSALQHVAWLSWLRGDRGDDCVQMQGDDCGDEHGGDEGVMNVVAAMG